MSSNLIAIYNSFVTLLRKCVSRKYILYMFNGVISKSYKAKAKANYLEAGENC